MLAVASALAIGIGGLVSIPNASAAASVDCPKNAQVVGGAYSYGAWDSSRSYVYNTSSRWCAYDERLGYRFTWQSDGNLVAYAGAHTGGAATWATMTNGRGAVLAFQSDGNVVIYDANGQPIWATGTWSPITARSYKFSIEQSAATATYGSGPAIRMKYSTEATSRYSQRLDAWALDSSGQAIPVGTIPGWKLAYSQDWKTTASSAQMSTTYKDIWCPYDDGVADFYHSTTSVHDGVFDFNLDGTKGGAGWFATTGGCDKGGDIYGRYSMRIKATGGYGYMLASMLWPNSDVWGEGEVDFPEGYLHGTMYLWQHGVGCGNSCAQNVDGYSTGVSFTDWHTVTVEWMPTSLKYYLDGRLIRTQTTNIPTTQHRHTLQMSPWIPGQPGHFYIAWTASWRPA